MRLWFWLLCALGMHNGLCVDGAYRCSHCDYVDPYPRRQP